VRVGRCQAQTDNLNRVVFFGFSAFPHFRQSIMRRMSENLPEEHFVQEKPRKSP
jgi:hypothetical protein